MYLAEWQIVEYTARRGQIEELLVALDACLLSFITNPTQSYTLNTGMTQQQVTRVNLPALRAWADDLRRERMEILGWLNCSPRSAYMRPGF